MLKWIESDPWMFAIVTGVIGSVVYAVLVRLTRFGARSWKWLKSAAARGIRFLGSIRVTTTRRIDARIDAAVKTALTPPAQPAPAWVGAWKVLRDPQPRTWQLVNGFPEEHIVRRISSTDPAFQLSPRTSEPTTVGPGETLQFEGSFVRSSFSDKGPRLLIDWEDPHGDAHIVTVPIDHRVTL